MDGKVKGLVIAVIWIVCGALAYIQNSTLPLVYVFAGTIVVGTWIK